MPALPAPAAPDESPPRRSADFFRELYERHFDYVWAGLRRLGIPSRDLPDVTHDVFLVVHRNLFKYDETRPLRPWLFGVLARVASDHLRLARNRLERLHERDERDDTAEPCHAGSTPEAEAALREQWRILDRALATLPPHHRVVLVMHDLAGHSAREVSNELGIPFKTVYSRLHAARLRVLTHTRAHTRSSTRSQDALEAHAGGRLEFGA
ncbi:MAG: polymerase sigma factor RpoE [Myxococcales bacterium]|nr:polymerase sigma factor RpoE [Myxococcales bacterium]